MSSPSSSQGVGMQQQQPQSNRRWQQRSSSNESSPASDDVGVGGKQSANLQVNKPTVGRSPSPYQVSSTSPSTTGHTSGSGSSSGSGTKLAQEIHDEFLVCKICLDGYKNPKCLDCLHTFCEQCIDSHVNSEPTYKKYSDYREFTCPLCRKRTQLPVGGVRKLPDNFLVSSLIEVVGRQKPPKYPFCDFCKMVNRKHREATSKCLDCSKLLCANCVHMHRNTKVTSGHSLFDVEIEKEIECKDHHDEVVRFYCEPCDTCICVLCTFMDHRDHEITHFNDAVIRHKDRLHALLKTCKDKTERFDDQVHALDKVEDVIKDVEKKIRATAIQFIEEIRTQEKELLDELQNIYGSDCTDCIQGKKEMIHQAENLRNTCSLTEVILMGKDMELLLLKKDVEDKLNALNALQLQDLPKTSSKVVDFISGGIDFGCLHDLSQPLSPSKMPRRDEADRKPVTPQLPRIEGRSRSGTSVETSVQTDRPVGGGGSKVDQQDHWTMTEEFPTQGGVPGGQGQGGQMQSAGDESPDEMGDSSLAARRRRRRERGQVAGGGCWAGGAPQPQPTAQRGVPAAGIGFGVKPGAKG